MTSHIRGFIGWIVTIPLVLIGVVIIIFGYYEARKIYWNAKVAEMCAKDGGTKVFETVSLTKDEYVLLLNQFGQLSPPLESRAAKDVPIVHNNTYTYVRRNDPEVRRDELVVIRRSDRKVLATQVSYSRVGGDLIAFHPSSFSCPETSKDIFSAVIRQK